MKILFFICLFYIVQNDIVINCIMELSHQMSVVTVNIHWSATNIDHLVTMWCLSRKSWVPNALIIQFNLNIVTHQWPLCNGTARLWCPPGVGQWAPLRHKNSSGMPRKTQRLQGTNLEKIVPDPNHPWRSQLTTHKTQRICHQSPGTRRHMKRSEILCPCLHGSEILWRRNYYVWHIWQVAFNVFGWSVWITLHWK